MADLLSHPLVLFSVGIFLYYRPFAKSGRLNDYPQPGKQPGHIDDLFNLGKAWFEDPQFFLKRY